VARPLTQLLRREVFVWTTAADEAFSILKHILANGLTLQLLDFTAPSSSNVTPPTAASVRRYIKTQEQSRSTVSRWCYSTSSWWHTSAR
jgi:hypothetical protein